LKKSARIIKHGMIAISPVISLLPLTLTITSSESLHNSIDV
jgi:hypothetical protein